MQRLQQHCSQRRKQQAASIFWLVLDPADIGQAPADSEVLHRVAATAICVAE
jgi:hypothetical protein